MLITIDTLRADRVGAYGDATARTPTMDALAAEGVRFEVAISPAPLTLPSHASLMTALDPPDHGVRHNGVFKLEEGIATLAERLRDQGFATAAFVSAYVLDRRFGLDRGFETYDDRLSMRRPGGGFLQIAQRSADRVAEAAIGWIEQAPGRFFLWVHFYDPHAQYTPPPRFAASLPDDPYAAEIAFADFGAGRVLAAVRGRWPDERTLVVVTSDHGEELGEHGEPTHSYGLYDGTQRIPLLMSGPTLPRGRVVGELVRLVDVAPTLLELVGAPPLEHQSGRSLIPLIREQEDAARVAYVETLATQIDMRWSPLLGLRTQRYKYVRAPRPELYDLEADPHEVRNLADSDAKRAGHLDRLLESRLTGARPARPNLRLDPSSRSRLESLGYLVANREPDPQELGVVGGADPKDEIGLLATVNEANGLIASRRPAEALALLAPLADRGHEVQCLRAMAALQANRLELAKQAAKAAIAAAPSRPNGYGLLGEVLQQQGRLTEAGAAYRQAAAVAPGKAWPITLLGRLAEARGELEAAGELYEKALRSRVPHAETVWRLAALRLEDGRFREATGLLARLPPHALREESAAIRLSRAEYAAGRIEMGLIRVEAGLRENPDSAALLLLKGSLLEKARRPHQALEAREGALALAPDDPIARNDVAWNLALLGRDLDRALDLAKSAAAATDSAPGFLDTLAAVRLRRGEPAQALPWIDRALPDARGETRSLLLFHRAEALAMLGRREAATAALRRAVEAVAPQPRAWTDHAERIESLLH